MPLDLNSNFAPIDQNDPAYQDFLADLQGNILNGHGRDHAIHLFIQFLPRQLAEVKRWISDLTLTKITSARSQLEASEHYKWHKTDAGLFTHFALTASGYDYLKIPKKYQPAGINPRQRPKKVPDSFGNPIQFYENSFQMGMKARQDVLLDPPVDAWEDGFQAKIDALVLLAADNPADLAAAELELRQQLLPIATINAVETGLTLRRKFDATVNNSAVQREFGNVVEHFGYADGVSQPAFLLKQLESTTSQYWKHPGASLQLVLVDDPNGTNGISFGSFLVFRKLEQNVKGFKTAKAKLAKALGLPKELAGAMAVGRFEDGTPVVLQAADGGWTESPKPMISNDFNYASDPNGLKCPFHAHVRKSNPRLESVKPGGNLAQSEAEELGHRIARRGMSYGGPLSTSEDLDSLPEKGVGLLFMCYQADIWEQFEFIQRLWCNNPNFLEPGLSNDPAAAKTGLDALIGQRQGTQSDPIVGEAPTPPVNWPQAWGKPVVEVKSEPELQFSQFVTLKGGEYFFSPSITFLRNLPNLTF